jgi:hypothetical protein
MKLTNGFFFLLALGIIAASCSKSDDDDSNSPDPGSTFFMWDIDGTTYDAASTSTFDGVGLYISAEDRNDAQTTMEIRSRTNGVGVRILSKNDGDPDDDQLMVFKFQGAHYITTDVHFIVLSIISVDEQKKEMEGTFQGQVVNKDDMNDVVSIDNGSFFIRYF